MLEVGGGGASGNNVNDFPSAVLFRKFTYWSYSLKEETCSQRFSRLCGCPWNLLKIGHTQKFISAKLFKTGHQQKFMPAKF